MDKVLVRTLLESADYFGKAFGEVEFKVWENPTQRKIGAELHKLSLDSPSAYLRAVLTGDGRLFVASYDMIEHHSVKDLLDDYKIPGPFYNVIIYSDGSIYLMAKEDEREQAEKAIDNYNQQHSSSSWDIGVEVEYESAVG